MSSQTPFGQFKIYPRGFLGAFRAPILTKKPSSGRTQRLQYDVTLFDVNDSKVVVANTAIEELYNQFIRRDQDLRSFEFREKILREVLWAFGTLDFEAWYLAQFNSPSFGVNHRALLDDTLKFILSGTRNMQLNLWESILSSGDEQDKDPDLSEQARNFFGKDYVASLTPSGRNRLTEVVQRWISNPNGMTDLLGTTHILFGLNQ